MYLMPVEVGVLTISFPSEHYSGPVSVAPCNRMIWNSKRMLYYLLLSAAWILSIHSARQTCLNDEDMAPQLDAYCSLNARRRTSNPG